MIRDKILWLGLENSSYDSQLGVTVYNDDKIKTTPFKSKYYRMTCDPERRDLVTALSHSRFGIAPK